MSEQANNRQGAGWLGVGTLTAAEVNALSARAAAGPGTESNRARAMRSVVAILPDGTRHTLTAPSLADLDAAKGARCGCGAYPGQDHWSDCATIAQPAPIAVQAWRRPDGALVVSGSDGVDRVTKPGEIRTPEDADRLFGKGFGLGRWMRENSGAAVLTNVTPERPGDHESPTGPRCNCGLPPDGTGGHARGCPARRPGQGTETPAVRQPAPAPGQVWLCDPRHASSPFNAPDGTATIKAVNHRAVDFVEGGTMDAQDLADPRGGWTCIGVSTPHGRVMVGDTFGNGHITVLSIPCDDQVRVRDTSGVALDPATYQVDAHALARGQEGPRTRYAPARAGQSYRHRPSRHVYAVSEVRSGRAFLSGEGPINSIAENPDHAQWERLDPGQGIQRGTLAHAVELANDVHAEWARALGSHAPQGKLGAVEREDAEAVLRQMSTGIGPRYVLAPTELLAAMSIRRAPREPVRVEVPIDAAMREESAAKLGATTLTLQAPAAHLRALFDAIGRAVEGSEPHGTIVGGVAVLVQRDEMLFTPTYSTGVGSLVLAGDARALCALRAAVATAMANGAATIAQWGAKGPRVEVRREGGAAMRATTASEPSEAPRYQPDAGGAGAWRWEV